MIEAVSEQTLETVLPLIHQYQAFYQVADICDDRNRRFFSQFGLNKAEGCQFVYREQGQAVAFATVYFTFTSTIAAKVAVLNDVFVDERVRGKGIAKQLIQHCHHYAQTQGAVRLQWVTALDNTPAQQLYDKMNTQKSTWYFYTYQGD